MSRNARKTVFWVSDPVRHKTACTVTEAGQKIGISDLRRTGIVLCSEIKGADLRLIFSHRQKYDMAHIVYR